MKGLFDRLTSKALGLAPDILPAHGGPFGPALGLRSTDMPDLASDGSWQDRKTARSLPKSAQNWVADLPALAHGTLLPTPDPSPQQPSDTRPAAVTTGPLTVPPGAAVRTAAQPPGAAEDIDVAHLAEPIAPGTALETPDTFAQPPAPPRRLAEDPSSAHRAEQVPLASTNTAAALHAPSRAEPPPRLMSETVWETAASSAPSRSPASPPHAAGLFVAAPAADGVADGWSDSRLAAPFPTRPTGGAPEFSGPAPGAAAVLPATQPAPAVPATMPDVAIKRPGAISLDLHPLHRPSAAAVLPASSRAEPAAHTAPRAAYASPSAAPPASPADAEPDPSATRPQKPVARAPSGAEPARAVRPRAEPAPDAHPGKVQQASGVLGTVPSPAPPGSAAFLPSPPSLVAGSPDLPFQPILPLPGAADEAMVRKGVAPPAISTPRSLPGGVWPAENATSDPPGSAPFRSAIHAGEVGQRHSTPPEPQPVQRLSVEDGNRHLADGAALSARPDQVPSPRLPGSPMSAYPMPGSPLPLSPGVAGALATRVIPGIGQPDSLPLPPNLRREGPDPDRAPSRAGATETDPAHAVPPFRRAARPVPLDSAEGAPLAMPALGPPTPLPAPPSAPIAEPARPSPAALATRLATQGPAAAGHATRRLDSMIPPGRADAGPTLAPDPAPRDKGEESRERPAGRHRPGPTEAPPAEVPFAAQSRQVGPASSRDRSLVRIETIILDAGTSQPASPTPRSRRPTPRLGLSDYARRRDPGGS